jgi:hypothetical protein
VLESLTHLGDGESFPSRSRFRRVKTHIDIPRSGILFAHPNSTLSLLILSSVPFIRFFVHLREEARRLSGGRSFVARGDTGPAGWHRCHLALAPASSASPLE